MKGNKLKVGLWVCTFMSIKNIEAQFIMNNNNEDTSREHITY